MMKYSFLVAPLLIFTFIHKGLGGTCGLNNIVIGTERSGSEVQGKPEWSVKVINNCTDCSQKQIVVSCPGFQTAEPVPPSLLLKQGDNCLVNGGAVLLPQASVSFAYAWDSPFIFWPKSSIVQCFA